MSPIRDHGFEMFPYVLYCFTILVLVISKLIHMNDEDEYRFCRLHRLLHRQIDSTQTTSHVTSQAFQLQPSTSI